MTESPQRQWTPAQQWAITARERTLVAAAAGSGKTSVLTERIVQALRAGEAAPADVCAVTFTEKAAQEMRERIADRLIALDELELLGSLELARIGTIHSLCAWILRRYGTAVGIDPAVGVLDEAQSAWLERGAMRRTIEAWADDPDVFLLRSRMRDEAIIDVLRQIHRIAMAADGHVQLADAADLGPILDPRRGSVLLGSEDARALQRGWIRLWSGVSAAIEHDKQQLGRITFDDLERLAVEAVRIPDVRMSLRSRWSFVLVDEFQDTNARQFELLDQIGGDRLFMVGDEWQSIYRFRGADIDVFRARRQEPSATLVLMRENFRSDAPILEVVNRVFAHERVFGPGYEPVLPGSDAQRSAADCAVELLVVPEADPGHPNSGRGTGAREREAARVAERIAELVASGTARPEEIAVLYARRTGAQLYEDALRAWGLPVLRAASDGLYDQRDVRDALAVLALLRNRSDEHAALTVLAGPIARLAWEELALLVRSAHEQHVDLLDAAALSGIEGAQRVALCMQKLEEAARTSSLVELVARVIAIPELELGAANDRNGLIRLANLRRLVELADSASQVDVRDVAGLLEFIEAQRRDARVGEASVADERMGAIRLMTIHAAKGLEFPYVFVVDAAASTAGRSGSAPAPRVGEDAHVLLGLPTVTGTHLTSDAYDASKLLEQQAQQEENLRLWYVAMTRARTRLFISAHWNFAPTKRGTPRALGGALKWLAEALELPADLGGVDSSYDTLHGLLRVDTHAATKEPVDIWQRERGQLWIAAPIELDTPVERRPAPSSEPDEIPAQLQVRLQAAVDAGPDEEWRQLEGTRIHDAVARLLEHARSGAPLDQLLDPERGPWITDRVRRRLQPVVAAPVFERLVALGARAEVPYLGSTGEVIESRVAPGVQVAARASDIDAGRFDALAQLPDATWWIVDWKSRLPDDARRAWQGHGLQLRRYANVAVRGGAARVLVSLVPLDRPAEVHTWELSDAWLSSAADRAEPPRAALPELGHPSLP